MVVPGMRTNLGTGMAGITTAGARILRVPPGMRIVSFTRVGTDQIGGMMHRTGMSPAGTSPAGTEGLTAEVGRSAAQMDIIGLSGGGHQHLQVLSGTGSLNRVGSMRSDT